MEALIVRVLAGERFRGFASVEVRYSKVLTLAVLAIRVRVNLRRCGQILHLKIKKNVPLSSAIYF